MSSLPVILVRAYGPDVTEAEVSRSLAELKLLLAGIGIRSTDCFLQRRTTGASPTYLGKGKINELAARTGGPGDLAPNAPRGEPTAEPRCQVVVDDQLTASQHRQLELALDCEVLDRTAVVLRVFESRAQTHQARLELELARLQLELPRIRDLRSLGDREGGGGRASRGDTNAELARQRSRARMATIRRELEALEHAGNQSRLQRSDVFRIALVGYTNAGKSSLMRQLTGAEVLVEDRPFATLSTTVRQLAPPAKPTVLVADTVGFIERLPHELVASFRSTLSEALEAWLLLLVVDVSDPGFRQHLDVTQRVLAEIGAQEVPVLLVLNKSDRLDAPTREALRSEFPDGLLVSAHMAEDGLFLRERILDFFARQLVEQTFEVPYAKANLLAEFRANAQVVSEQYAEHVTVTVRSTPAKLKTWSARLR